MGLGFVSVWLALGIQLVALGLVGAYVGKTYGEVKARPRYHIEMLLDAAQTQRHNIFCRPFVGVLPQYCGWMEGLGLEKADIYAGLFAPQKAFTG